jgi:hypothetical protein
MGKFDHFVACFSLLAVLAGLPVSGALGEELTAEALNSGTMDTAPQQYRDEYLLDSDSAALMFEEEKAALPGRRFFATELVYYNNDSDFLGDQTEQGLRTRWRRETLKYGDFSVDLNLSNIDRNYIGISDSSSDVLATFRQQNLAFTNEWMMNNTVGYQRTFTADSLAGGYRVRLPNSPLLGISSEIYAEDRSAHFFRGRTGQVVGVTLNQFEQDGGDLFGAGYQQLLSDSWSLAGQFVNYSGNKFSRAHSSVLGSVNFTDPVRLTQYDLRLLVDDDSNYGLWADGEQLLRGDFIVRYGLFYMQPNLAWMDKPISNDQRGFYARMDKQTYNYSLAAGYDFLEFGLNEADGSRSTSHNFYVNGNYRVSRNLNLGVAATLISRSVLNTDEDNQSLWRLNNFAYYRSLFGTSRLELYASNVDTRIDSSSSDTMGFLISQQWNTPQTISLTTDFRLENSNDGAFDNRRSELSALFRHDFLDQFSWGANVTSYANSSDYGSSNDGIGVTLDMRWQFLPDWYASLNWIRNDTTFQSGSVTSPGSIERTANTFWLTVGYSKNSGAPIRSLGNRNGSLGSGIVEGELFFDENNDFIRQAGEKPVAGAIVLLDGRYEARTDSLGRYKFEPVYTGTHRVSIEVSELPLPWGLHDETPRSVNVGLRAPGIANFAVSRID